MRQFKKVNPCEAWQYWKLIYQGFQIIGTGYPFNRRAAYIRAFMFY